MARPDKISGADINSICQEVSDGFSLDPGRGRVKTFLFETTLLQSFGPSWSPWGLGPRLSLPPPSLGWGHREWIVTVVPQQSGMLAVRENRYIVLAKDFEKAYKTVIKKDEQEHEFYK